MGARRKLNFIKECMTTNKICSKFRFFKRLKIKMDYLLFVLCFVQSFGFFSCILKAFWRKLDFELYCSIIIIM